MGPEALVKTLSACEGLNREFSALLTCHSESTITEDTINTERELTNSTEPKQATESSMVKYRKRVIEERKKETVRYI